MLNLKVSMVFFAGLASCLCAVDTSAADGPFVSMKGKWVLNVVPEIVRIGANNSAQVEKRATGARRINGATM